MRGTAANPLRLEFARSTAFRREQELFAKQVERQRKNRSEDARDDADLAELNAIVVMAAEAEIEALRIKIDAYDAGTTEALMENDRLRDIAQAKIDDILNDAFVLPDGRRVFKSKDGRVFDEHGVELGADDIDPDLIEDWRPGYEAYVLVIDEKKDLDQERADFLSFQERIDQAREEIEADNLTKHDLDTIEDELKAAMPTVARKTLPDYEQPVVADMRGDFAAAAPAPKINVSDLSRDLKNLMP